MLVIRLEDLLGKEREVRCPQGGFTSYRFLLKSDNMGFSLHTTVIPKGGPQHWHYKNHLEACYCVSGRGVLTDSSTGEEHLITTDTVYALDQHDDHLFQALEDTVLISIFNPPLQGAETHDEDGVYLL